MKRLHLHVGVADLEEAIRFYSALFGAQPVKRKAGYAKWLVDDPRVNFAISTRPERQGLNHLGIQVDDEPELAEIRERAGKADLSLFDEGETICCYARSDKSWLLDPAGVPWEAYRTMEDADIYENTPIGTTRAAACCGSDRSRDQSACC
jgi:catechol 2,3-dioxygenase-like lactoylglutathione lyase family enzyme